jgi:hypothetical protein
MSIRTGSSLDDVSVELKAMQTIARVLAGVGDPEARRRILRWANERFDAPAARPASGSAPPAPASDPTLSVDDLNLFDDDRAAARADPSTAFDVEPSCLFDNQAPGALDGDALAPNVDTPAAAATPAASNNSEQSLDSLVRGFATDLRALALQCQSA